jgi:hypothetical protein
MTMTLYEFNCLSQNERADAVWQSGRFIKSISSPGVSKALYGMGDFFVEVSYTPEGGIFAVRGFKSQTCLEPYNNIGLPLLITMN